MKKRALVILSEGFEDVEAVAPIDVLTRAGIEVSVASIDRGPVRAAYGSVLVPQVTLDEVSGLFDAIVLPGGRGNAEQMARNPLIIRKIREHHVAGKIVAAICASSPFVLGEAAGILKGRKATGFPDFNDRLEAAGAMVTNEQVTIDGNIITGMGPGAALRFGLAIAERLVGKGLPDALADKWRIDR